MTELRYAMISDIHANVHALDAVLADMAVADVAATYHIGDLSATARCQTIEFKRMAYDNDGAVAALHAAGLPTDFAEFLRTSDVSNIRVV